MITVKTMTLKEQAAGPVKTFMFSGATSDASIKSFGDAVVQELNESGNYIFSAEYSTTGIYTPNEVETLYKYATDFIPIDYRGNNP